MAWNSGNKCGDNTWQVAFKLGLRPKSDIEPYPRRPLLADGTCDDIPTFKQNFFDAPTSTAELRRQKTGDAWVLRKSYKVKGKKNPQQEQLYLGVVRNTKKNGKKGAIRKNLSKKELFDYCQKQVHEHSAYKRNSKLESWEWIVTSEWMEWRAKAYALRMSGGVKSNIEEVGWNNEDFFVNPETRKLLVPEEVADYTVKPVNELTDELSIDDLEPEIPFVDPKKTLNVLKVIEPQREEPKVLDEEAEIASQDELEKRVKEERKKQVREARQAQKELSQQKRKELREKLAEEKLKQEHVNNENVKRLENQFPWSMKRFLEDNYKPWEDHVEENSVGCIWHTDGENRCYGTTTESSDYCAVHRKSTPGPIAWRENFLEVPSEKQGEVSESFPLYIPLVNS